MTKVCSKCKQELDDSRFYSSSRSPDGLQHYCISCVQEYRGYTPIDKSVKSASYLGIYIAEQIFQNMYPQAKHMPTGNPRYDFECPDGITVDVKSSTLHRNNAWYFSISYNTTPDYFWFVAFNNRTQLQVQHIWLVPQPIVGNTTCIAICSGRLSLSKWEQYELSIKEVIYVK
jgi:hypothetical protein